ncbi:MAG: sulfotransferase family 2 domain-containing protein [Leptolyngbyaceae bacterium]|nr:sulfotransferase family 2 domain-containing protein [Leptolyngbyaceae bacterium]
MKPSALESFHPHNEAHIEQLKLNETLIFLHVMKTGGTSLFRILEQNYPSQHTFHFGNQEGRTLEDFDNLSLETRDRLKLIHGHLEFGFHHHLSQPCRYITMLREPINRVVSLYYFLYQNPPRRPPEGPPCETLRDFLELGVLGVDNNQTRRIAGEISNHYPFGECTADLLDIAKENLSKFLFVGITEQFDESLIVLRRKLGIDKILYFPVRSNSRKPKLETVDPRDIEHIKAFNQLDIELYQFGNELLEQVIRQAGDSFRTEYYFFKLANQQYRSKISEVASVKTKIQKTRKKIRRTHQARHQFSQAKKRVQDDITAIAHSRLFRFLQRLGIR